MCLTSSFSLFLTLSLTSFHFSHVQTHMRWNSFLDGPRLLLCNRREYLMSFCPPPPCHNFFFHSFAYDWPHAHTHAHTHTEHVHSHIFKPMMSSFAQPAPLQWERERERERVHWGNWMETRKRRRVERKRLRDLMSESREIRHEKREREEDGIRWKRRRRRIEETGNSAW